MKKDLQPGDILVHLAKVGSDFASGHGKMNQKKNSDFDEDGSHNSGKPSITKKTHISLDKIRTPLSPPRIYVRLAVSFISKSACYRWLPSGFQTLLVSKEGEVVFKNPAPGGSDLLRLFSKTTEKDSQERMVAEMKRLDKLSREIPQQVINT